MADGNFAIRLSWNGKVSSKPEIRVLLSANATLKTVGDLAQLLAKAINGSAIGDTIQSIGGPQFRMTEIQAQLLVNRNRPPNPRLAVTGNSLYSTCIFH